ncbi:HAD-IA family hydrolase, partial [Candidatus Pacearchaeota archaeon]|nr:HAD-IA family hydrolase [Candidatus Pacearchaeota archaeon]
DAKRILSSIKDKYKTGIITNGTPQTQRKKIICLGLEDVFDVFVYTAEFDAPKPSPTCFILAADALNVDTTDSIYIGDNPLIDFQGAKKAGMYTIRLRRGEFQEISPQDYKIIDKTICSYEELSPVIEYPAKLKRIFSPH